MERCRHGGSLRRMSGRMFDMLFVNAGTTNRRPTETIGEVSTEDFVDVMITNSLSPMRVVESLEHCVCARGTIGVMSSGQGSISNNETGLREVYRGSKAALNMFMRSFAARHAGTSRADGVDGSGLGPHRHGRAGSAFEHRRKRAEPG